MNTKIVADSPEPVIVNIFISTGTNNPAASIYNREHPNEMKKYIQMSSSNKTNTALVKINPTYNTPDTFHTAFALLALRNGTDAKVSSRKKAT